MLIPFAHTCEGMAQPPKLDIMPQLVQQEIDASEPCHQAGLLKLAVAPGTQAPSLPAQLVMIFDMSGSMRGRPMQLLEEALSHVYTNLRPQDKLSMIRFGGSASEDFSNWDKPTIESNGIQPFEMVGGGTNYDAAMSQSLATIRSIPGMTDMGTQHSVSKQAVFLTDGHPYPEDTANDSMDLAGEHPTVGFSFNAMSLNDSLSDDVKRRLMSYTEVGRGQYFHAADETDLQAKLDKMLKLSQNIVYASPALTMEVFPGVRISNVSLPLMGITILDNASTGTHTLDLPDIEQGTIQEICYEVHIDTPQPVGTVQEIVQWSIPGQPPVVSSVKWVNQHTAMLAQTNPRPTVLGTIAGTIQAKKTGNEAEAKRLAQTLTQMGTALGDNTATGVATVIEETEGSELDLGQVLEKISDTKTKTDGSV